MSSRNIEKWLLSDWGHGRDQATPKSKDDSLKSRKHDETTEPEGERRISNVIESVPGADNNLPEEDKDFSESASSWEPSDGCISSEDSDTEVAHSKTLKMEQYIRQYAKGRSGKKIPLPMHRPNAVVKVLQERKINENNRLNDSRKRKFQEALIVNKSLPDSTRKNTTPPKEETIIINKKEILEMKATFQELFRMLNNMKPVALRKNFSASQIVNENISACPRDSSPAKLVINDDIANVSDHESDRSQSEESNRSDDNVLISNKYHKACVSPKNQKQKSNSKEDEWIPIGSGKTLIHKDKYRKVNWKSYTIATRTLLLATFPRRILATHSLTGKRSPAFLNKPPKMCLDPKIVSDIIIEITSKFKVKENLVRGIITTKCADECKMLKMRLKSKNAPLKGFNMPQRNCKEDSIPTDNKNKEA